MYSAQSCIKNIAISPAAHQEYWLLYYGHAPHGCFCVGISVNFKLLITNFELVQCSRFLGTVGSTPLFQWSLTDYSNSDASLPNSRDEGWH